ncbi:hypothetical protein [Bacillus sp. 3255]|uniref:hypothetical protein n=1 Tax=Bacillus sp. 3255 TaxID=2817904 RepID=UPI00285493E0|nr:hypothetical protein [Bacillus sp. 3255]MDR6882407.1 hypothetical protein [Bacillus sp. 3255]
MLLLIHSILGTVALLTLIFSLRRLHPLETVLTFMMASCVLQNIETVLGANIKLFDAPTVLTTYLTFQLDRIVLYPSCLFWLTFFLSYTRNSLVMKIALTALGIFTMTAGQYLENHLTILTMKKWSIVNSLLEWGSLLIVTVGFSLFISKLLMKVKVKSHT